MPSRFNIRVYGLLVENGRVLLSDEYIKGMEVTKFPGGGLELGEGIAECLKREFYEELNLTIQIKEHFYTTDFYVVSAFKPDDQVISIYYLVEAPSVPTFVVSDQPHLYEKKEGAQSFRWMQISKMKDKDLSLVIDRKVAGMLISAYNTK